MTILIVHKDIMCVIIDAILFVLYFIFLNMHAPLVIVLSEINILQVGIAGRRVPPDNKTCSFYQLYLYSTRIMQ